MCAVCERATLNDGTPWNPERNKVNTKLVNGKRYRVVLEGIISDFEPGSFYIGSTGSRQANVISTDEEHVKSIEALEPIYQVGDVINLGDPEPPIGASVKVKAHGLTTDIYQRLPSRKWYAIGDSTGRGWEWLPRTDQYHTVTILDLPE